MIKVCNTCDRVLGEIEADSLTPDDLDSIINVVGNVAYALCPDCMSQLEVEPFRPLQ